MKVVLLHGYSRNNSGDGLLVDEARNLVLDALPGSSISLLALDGATFDQGEFTQILHPLTGANLNPSQRDVLTSGLLRLAGCSPNRRVAAALRESDLTVAVGGGYLRGGYPLEMLKTTLAHINQIPASRASVYLPQSIGPFPPLLRELVSHRLSRTGSVHVRDDRSLQFLRRNSNVQRSPDLAILGMPSIVDQSERVTGPGPVGLVARALPGSRNRHDRYVRAIQTLLASGQGFELLLQSEGRGNDDGAFYREALGQAGPFRRLKDAVSPTSDERPNAVVSVRLHGSLESIRSGVPSVHLSYERKGWGAYADLGLNAYVHNVYDFDTDCVATQVLALQGAAPKYWAAVDSSMPELRRARTRLIDDLRVASSGGQA